MIDENYIRVVSKGPEILVEEPEIIYMSVLMPILGLYLSFSCNFFQIIAKNMKNLIDQSYMNFCNKFTFKADVLACSLN